MTTTADAKPGAQASGQMVPGATGQVMTGVTIRDVARLAGVSVSTVSSALNGRGRVSAQTKARIESAAKALDYRPNPLAQAMVTGKTMTVGLVVAGVENPYFAEIIVAAEQAAAQQGYALVLCSSPNDPAAVAKYLDVLVGRRLDGIIMSTNLITTEQLIRVRSAGVPVITVFGHGAPAEANIPAICTDTGDSERLLIEHLIALGHQRIAFVGTPEHVAERDGRFVAYRATIAAAGLRFDPALVQYSDYTMASGRRLGAKLLRLKARPTAIATVNDAVALGVLQAARAANLSVPGDLSLVGFDDIPYASLVSPALTTVRLPSRKLGAEAFRLLMRLIDGKPCPLQTNLPSEVVMRESTAPPPAASLSVSSPSAKHQN